MVWLVKLDLELRMSAEAAYNVSGCHQELLIFRSCVRQFKAMMRSHSALSIRSGKLCQTCWFHLVFLCAGLR